MTERKRLPNRRGGELLDFEFRGKPYTLYVGRFDDGSLAEVFIDYGVKSGNDVYDDSKDAALCLSIALQYGVPEHVIREAVNRTSEGGAAGIIGCVLDIISKGEMP
jgi:hypothetical protein